jgi:hypothetical protein
MLVLWIFISCDKAPTSKQVTWEYKYEVSGTSGNYSVTIQNTDNNTQQWSSVGNGWWYKWNQTLTVDGNDTPLEGQTRWLYLSAQNNNSSGDVTVKIYRNGKVVATNTSYGVYSIATVSGNY